MPDPIAPPPVEGALALVGRTPMVRVRRLDAGPCEPFLKLESADRRARRFRAGFSRLALHDFLTRARCALPRRARRAAALFLAAALAAPAACAPGRDAEVERLSVAVIRQPATALYDLAQESGCFAAERLRAEDAAARPGFAGGGQASSLRAASYAAIRRRSRSTASSGVSTPKT